MTQIYNSQSQQQEKALSIVLQFLLSSFYQDYNLKSYKLKSIKLACPFDSFLHFDEEGISQVVNTLPF